MCEGLFARRTSPSGGDEKDSFRGIHRLDSATLPGSSHCLRRLSGNEVG